MAGDRQQRSLRGFSASYSPLTTKRYREVGFIHSWYRFFLPKTPVTREQAPIALNPYKTYTRKVHMSVPKLPIFNKLPKISFYPVLLFLIIFIICAKNYTPGTFLTGWDTLHPEFNLSLYWQRILGGVWQEHQGLGAVASQSHASEIPRILLISLIDFFFGLKFIRYAYAFLMLFLGSFGVYFFLKDVLLRKFQNPSKLLGAFVGALFYLLNLGTLQNFYVPLEMFLTHFGFLGWYMW